MRWIIRLTGGAVLLAMLVVLVISIIPADRIARIAAQEISNRMGREISMSGDVRPIFWPVLGVRTGRFTVANANWSETDDLLSAENLLVGVRLLPMFAGRVEISELRLERPEILLERHADGRANWVFPGPGKPANPVPDPGAGLGIEGVSLAVGRVTDGRITWLDHAAGTAVVVEKVDLRFSLPNGKPANVRGRAEVEGQTIRFAMSLAHPARAISGGVSDVSGELHADFGAITASGRAGFDPPGAEIELDAKVGDFPAFLQLLAPGTDRGTMPHAVELGGVITWAGDAKIFLRRGRIAVDGNQITGDADLALAATPRLTAKLAARDLDFSTYFTDDTGSGDKDRGAEQPGWSQTPFDFSGLGLIDAEILLAIESVNLGAATMGTTRLHAAASGGRVVVDLRELQAYGGAFTGEVVVNARQGLSMSADLRASDVLLRPMLTDFAGYDRLISTADMHFSLLTSGDNMARMMATLSGNGSFDLGPGEMIGLDLAGMLRNLDASYRGPGSRTIFSAVTGSFTVRDGILKNDDLDVQGDPLRATGEGMADLGNQRLTYRITPVAALASDGQGLSVPVLITGPWSNLHYKADIKGLFDQELESERLKAAEKLRKDAKKAQKAAEKKLRRDLEKAMEKGADKALQDALRRLGGE